MWHTIRRSSRNERRAAPAHTGVQYGTFHLECRQHGRQATPQQRPRPAGGQGLANPLSPCRISIDPQEFLTGHALAQLPETPSPRRRRGFADPIGSRCELLLTPQQDKAAGRAGLCQGRTTGLWSAVDSSRRVGGRYPLTFRVATVPSGDRLAPSIRIPATRDRGVDYQRLVALGLVAGHAISVARLRSLRCCRWVLGRTGGSR